MCGAVYGLCAVHFVGVDDGENVLPRRSVDVKCVGGGVGEERRGLLKQKLEALNQYEQLIEIVCRMI